jgi:hypothetical protein
MLLLAAGQNHLPPSSVWAHVKFAACEQDATHVRCIVCYQPLKALGASAGSFAAFQGSCQQLHRGWAGKEGLSRCWTACWKAQSTPRHATTYTNEANLLAVR